MSLTRSIDKAKEAYKSNDVKATIAAHSHAGHGHSEKHFGGKYIKSVVYGGLDGIITTFAVVSGVTGAKLSTGILLILGFANLFADGISMAFGDFLSTRAEQEYHKAERKREEWEVDNHLEGERQEMVEIYMQRGLSKTDAQKVVAIISKNKKTFVDIMMLEELGIVEDTESPYKNAFATFFSFAIFGFIPLLTYLLSYFSLIAATNQFLVACLLTGLALFSLGAVKTRVTEQNFVIAGVEMLLIGGIAAAVAYGIGFALAGLA
jgi:vacuolar iron transporter family protein